MDDAEKDEIKQLIKEFVVDKPVGGASKSPAKTKKTAAAKQSVLGLAGGASPSKKTPGLCPQALSNQAYHTLTYVVAMEIDYCHHYQIHSLVPSRPSFFSL